MRRRFRSFWVVAVLAAAAGCARRTPAAPPPDTRLNLVVSVDWEGRALADDNLAAMAAFRDQHPEVPLTQFLNAAYFTKPDARAPDVVARIRRALRPRDELGLHVHGWKRLFEAAGVAFRPGPTFWGAAQTSGDCAVDCGHDVPISLYTAPELRRVIGYSVRTLEGQGFGRARSFRTGGWMLRPNVRDALAAEGITRDSSAVTTGFLVEEIGKRALYRWLRELWPETRPDAQPYALPTAAGELLEVPDNGALADYVTPEDMLGAYAACRDAKRRDPGRPVTLSIGFHQETAARFVPRVAHALALIAAQARRDGVTVVPVTLAAVPRPR